MTCCHVTITLWFLNGFHELQALGYIYLANCVTSLLLHRLQYINMHIITCGFTILRAPRTAEFHNACSDDYFTGQHIQSAFNGRVYNAIYFKTGLKECSWRAGSVSLTGNGLILLLLPAGFNHVWYNRAKHASPWLHFAAKLCSE